MKFGKRPLTEILGMMAAHQVADDDGRKLLDKGQVITESDIQLLQAAKIDSLAVVSLEADDIEENEAAARVASLLFGENIRMIAPKFGRVNLIAESRGVFYINLSLFEQINSINEAVMIATLPIHSLVQAGQTVSMVKIFPYALPTAFVEELERIAGNQALMNIRALEARSVALLITGHAHQREKLITDYEAVVRNRLENLGSRLDTIAFCAHEENAISSHLRHLQAEKRDLILIAGIAATIDSHDVIPSALLLANGSITQLGIPVDPGILLLLGYLGKIPVIGAPSSLKSPNKNAIDLILPRLLAGEMLSRADLLALGHGGLLQD